jgi:predicted transcriptional regulator
MKINEIKKIIEAEILSGKELVNMEVKIGGGSDLVSDILSFSSPDGLLLTGLTTVQVIYAADAVDTKAICFVRGKYPPKDTIELAKEKKIVILKTNLHMFESCGRLYKAGLPG